MASRARLSEAEVKSFVAANSAWKIEQGELRRVFEFSSFADSMKFVNAIAELAEREDHHPDIDIRFKKVKVALVTYDADGITKRDTELALQIGALFKR